MQDFKGKSIYNCIVFRYCIGYLDDNLAPSILEKFSTYLLNYETKNERAGPQCSYIIVQDQILPPFCEEFIDEN